MEQDNEELVALVRQDAEDVLRMLSSQPGVEARPRVIPNSPMMFGRTTSAGIALTAPGNVTVYRPTATGWAASSPAEVIQCWAWPTAIVDAKDVLVFVVDGRFVAMEVC